MNHTWRIEIYEAHRSPRCGSYVDTQRQNPDGHLVLKFPGATWERAWSIIKLFQGIGKGKVYMYPESAVGIVADRLKQASHGPGEVLPKGWSDFACLTTAREIVALLTDSEVKEEPSGMVIPVEDYVRLKKVAENNLFSKEGQQWLAGLETKEVGWVSDALNAAAHSIN